MLPFYLLGNLHCLGMCGPFALSMGGQKGKYFYLIGRFLGFTLASAIAALFGEILSTSLVATLIPFLMGSVFILYYFNKLPSLPGFKWLEKLSTDLLLDGGKFPLFLFGFLTLFLPCGQSLLLYGVSAMKGDLYFGILNGALFALLTTPSLLFAMHLRPYLKAFSKNGDRWVRLFALLTGLLAFARGGATFGWLPHLSFPLGPTHLSLW